MALKPPPVAPSPVLHADSDWYAPLVPAVVKRVPPTAVTSGSEAGVEALELNELPSHVCCAAPWSPDDAKRVIPLSLASPNRACSCWISCGSAHLSASPELWEMTSPRLRSMAYFVTLSMSASAALLASTRSMAAPGAMACAHSTSIEISADQLT